MNRLDALAEKNTFILECNEGDTYDQGSAFYVPGIGLITSYHVVKSGGFFKAYKHESYPSKQEDVLGLSLKLLAADETIDYTVFATSISVEEEYALRIGDSANLRVGDQVTIIGYPNHQTGNTPICPKMRYYQQENVPAGTAVYSQRKNHSWRKRWRCAEF